MKFPHKFQILLAFLAIFMADRALVAADASAGGNDAPNYRQTFLMYRMAASEGDVGAMNNLGVMYELGEGVNRDFGQALYWYRKAADGGNPTAMYNVGCMYDNGRGMEADKDQAVVWYTKAAALGDVRSKSILSLVAWKQRSVLIEQMSLGAVTVFSALGFILIFRRLKRARALRPQSK